MISRLLLALIAAFAALPVAGECDGRYSDPQSTDYLLHADIPFGGNYTSDGEWKELLLDIYEPVEPSESPRPLVILTHGGSFLGGSKSMGEVTWFCEDLARRGVLAASISYRTESNPLSLLSEEKMVKAVIRAVEDVKAAVRFFHRYIDEGNALGIDAEAVFAGGTSAGSIAVLHTVFMDEFASLKPAYQTWIAELGIDTPSMHGFSGNAGYAETIAGVINISGAIVNEAYLDNNSDVPILNMHNEIDLSVPYMHGYPYFIPTLPIVAGSRPIHFRMLENGGDSRLVTFPGINHIPHTSWEGEQYEPAYSQSLGEIISFLERNTACDELVTANQAGQLIRPLAYPNPASDFLVLEGVENLENYRFSLYAADGSARAEGLQPRGGRIVFAGLDLNPGLYFLSGTDQTGIGRIALPVAIR